jgi:SAM-dependent methyltransferase
MQNFNIYDPVLFKNFFVTTELYSQIQKDFDLITWDVDTSSFSITGMTPRQYRGMKIFSAVPFYYINQIGLDSKIYDIGCGWNIYKKYLPDITGISAEPSESKYFYADEHGIFDDTYVENNLQKFDNVISMNSLHFIPLTEFTNRIHQLKKVTRPGGKIFVMMNVCQMIAKENSNIKNSAGEYIRNQMSQFSKDLLCFELDDDRVTENLSEGTLRFVLCNNE